MPDDFFDQRREWSRWKHETLRRYLARFVGILCSHNRFVYQIDAFAGAGAYRAQHIPGSPLLAATIAEWFTAHQKLTCELRCINVEPNHREFQRLVAETAKYPSPIVHNRRGEFGDLLGDILATIRDAPALFFLDPYGFKGMEWNTVYQVADRFHHFPTELIINFNGDELYQAAGWRDSVDRTKAPAFVQTVTAFFGTDDWLRVCDSAMTKAQCIEQLADLYMDRLTRIIGGFVARYPVRTRKGQLKYYLLFATKHARGVREFSDIIFDVESQYQVDLLTYRPTAGDLEQHRLHAAAELLPDQKKADADIVSNLAVAMPEALAGRSLTFGAVQTEMALHGWFGRARIKHYRAAVKQLIGNGKISGAKATGVEDKTSLTFAA
ncbi:MAG: three-Cys-motif partner protein TcmP [Chloroflexota bacterium]